MTDVTSEKRTVTLGIVLLTAVLVLVTVDVVADWGKGVEARHLVVEGAAALVAGFGAAVLLLRLRALLRESRSLRRQLAATRSEAERWREEAADLLSGLAAAIDAQFERWQLTPAEREIALLLLRGFSHKQVASLRGVSERTVRQQAHLLYRKTGLASRADLAAFFLDDLLRPREPAALSGSRG